MSGAAGSSLLPCVEIETGDGRPRAAVVWMHGLGADGHDFEPIVPQLGLAPKHPIRFIFPHAPERPVTINMGARMRAWYDVAGLDLDQKQDEAGIRQSAELIERLIAREKERGLRSREIVLAGFSQGGAMAYHTGLRYAEPLAGLIVLSGYLPLADVAFDEAHAANRAIPILQCHGSYDPLVPIELGSSTAELVRRRGYDVDWRTYPVQHGIHPQEIADVGAFLVRVLNGTS